MSQFNFPPGFLWGTATAAHQVEGANDNSDWWDWERTPGHIKNGDTSAVACDWWKGGRYAEDFDLAKSLGQNAHRLAVDWSRIEPREGEWNADAFAFYRRVLDALRERNMVPLVTLHHFANPRWLAAKGAWETAAVIPLFERYAAKVVGELGEWCDFWVTINEPIVYAFSGYSNGIWPPGKKDFVLGFRVLANMVRGHAAAYHAIHQVQPDARVGVAHHLIRFLPTNVKSRLDRWAASLRDRMANRLFLRALVDGQLRFPMSGSVPGAVNSQDYVAANYYFAEECAFDLGNRGQFFTRGVKPLWNAPVPEFARTIYPAGLYDFLGELSALGKPIYITENGLFDLGDDTQARYLVSHLVQVQRATAEGLPVKGYFYWTLVDNFEWAEGFSARFGLYHLDVSTQTRSPRPSAEIYARIARENGITEELMEKYRVSS
jgi:beta-glucosidase